MKTIYIDELYHCHTINAEGRTPIETDIFDSMCDNEIECYLYKPLEDDRCFVQCFDSKSADSYRKQYQQDKELFKIISGEVSIDE